MLPGMPLMIKAEGCPEGEEERGVVVRTWPSAKPYSILGQKPPDRLLQASEIAGLHPTGTGPLSDHPPCALVHRTIIAVRDTFDSVK